MARARRTVLLVVVSVSLIGLYVLFGAAPPGPRSLKAFDPDRVALLELDMWKAYYAKENRRLFVDLVTLNHEQYRYPWATSIRSAFYLARAAATFGRIRSDYEQVLPDLERAYTIARRWTGATFDPSQVARAELAWWEARRMPGRNSPDEVGGLIADENALLYDVPRTAVLEASVLRAQAGRLRDDGGDHADWDQVSALLLRSYRALAAGVGSQR